MHNYHSQYGCLPAGAYCPRPGGGLCAEIYGCHTWLESLLPHLEQQPLFDRLDFHVGLNKSPNRELLVNLILPGLTCPSDPHAGLLDLARFSSSVCQPLSECMLGGAGTMVLGQTYTPNGGPMSEVSTTPPAVCTIPPWPDSRNCYPLAGGRGRYGSEGLFAAGFGICYRFADCSDGLSHTFLIGEQLPSYAQHMLYFHSHLTTGSTNIPPNYHRLVPECPPEFSLTSPPYCAGQMQGYKSDHPGGLNMATADGSVHFIHETIEYRTWVFLGSRRDGEIAKMAYD